MSGPMSAASGVDGQDQEQDRATLGPEEAKTPKAHSTTTTSTLPLWVNELRQALSKNKK